MDMAVLLLDNTYEPLKIIGWMKAMTLIFSGKVEVVEESDMQIRSANNIWTLPCVVRQVKKFKRRSAVQFNRVNVYTRDAWTCQYCVDKKPAKELTFDHVVPRFQGGKTSWTNIVTACRPCNNYKDSRTPEQANMKLLKKPEQPKWLPTQMVIKMKVIPEKWQAYVKDNGLSNWEIELEGDE